LCVGQFENVEQWKPAEIEMALEAYLPAIVRHKVPVGAHPCFESLRRAVVAVPDFEQRPGMPEFCSLFSAAV
jgi:hypothetical protein